MKIYLKEPELTSLSSLIFNGFSELVPYHRFYKFVTTYNDEECTKLECNPARRSFEDLLKIGRTYFPETTEGELISVLYELHKRFGIGAFWCPDIRKYVFYNRQAKSDIKFIVMNNGIYDKSEKGNGEYSYNDLIKLIEENGNICENKEGEENMEGIYVGGMDEVQTIWGNVRTISSNI